MRACATLLLLLGASTACTGGSAATDAAPPLPDRAHVIEELGLPPFDPGPVVRAPVAPPPISGGTLAISADGALAVAADPDSDAIHLVDLVERTVRSIDLPRGSEPGRVALDASGGAHVVLRGGGGIADVDLATATVATRAICSVPRGIAWRASDDTLHVACADGVLATLPAAGGGATRVLRPRDDLRDVIVVGEELWVTRFRSATLLRVDAAGSIVAELALPSAPIVGTSRLPRPGRFEPAVAWRAIASEGGVLVLHQRHVSSALDIAGPTANPYGGAECGASAVETAVTHVAADGTMRTSRALFDVSLGVDLAASPDAMQIAVAAPANAYLRFQAFGRGLSGTPVFASTEVLAAISSTGDCAPPLRAGPASLAGTIAVAYLPDGRVVAQTRAPSQLLVQDATPITLSERATFDTGHAIFHGRTASGLACASCHPEGGDDGRTWSFAGIGPRRTQSVRGGILDTAPFHWDGDMESFEALVSDVYRRRMSGQIAHADEVPALEAWLAAQPALPRPLVEDAESVERGRAFFESAEVACSTCHLGEDLTSGLSVDVGTGGVFQVPTLVGIAYRAPYLHSGCAPTLRDRFGPCGGGDMHGHTSALDETQIGDLVAYLRTL